MLSNILEDSEIWKLRVFFFFTFTWPCIVTTFFIIKPTRCTNFTLALNFACFGQCLCPSTGVYSLYTQQWCMSYRFIDSFRAGLGWPCSKAVYKPLWHIPLLRVQWIDSWWGTDALSETCRFSCQNTGKFFKSVHLVGFVIKKLRFMFQGLLYFVASA